MNPFAAKELKLQARRLQSAVGSLLGTPVRLSTAYELLAQTHGYPNWDTAARSLPHLHGVQIEQGPARRLPVRLPRAALDRSLTSAPQWVQECCSAIANGQRPLVLVSGSTGTGRSTLLELLGATVCTTTVASPAGDRLLSCLMVSDDDQVVRSVDIPQTAELLMRKGADLFGIDISDGLVPLILPEILNTGHAVAVALHAASATLALDRLKALMGIQFTLPATVPVLSVHCARRLGPDTEIDWQWLRTVSSN